MSVVEQYTYWGFTINNPDENDLVLVRNANEKYIRNLVYTHEEGSEGTPHIQGYIRLFRNQTLTFVKRLFPRANFRPLKKDEYELNMRNYVQKDDETTRSPHVQINNAVENDALAMIMAVLEKYCQEYPKTAERLRRKDLLLDDAYPSSDNDETKYEFLRDRMKLYENDMVTERPYLAKLFTSPSYDRMLERFWRNFLLHIYYKHVNSSDASSSQTSDYSSGTGSQS